MKTARIELRAGDEAIDRLRKAVTGNEDDVLLAIEQVLHKYVDADRPVGDPYTDTLGVFVDELEVT